MSTRLDTFDRTRHVPASSKPSTPLRLNERETCSDGEVQSLEPCDYVEGSAGKFRIAR